MRNSWLFLLLLAGCVHPPRMPGRASAVPDAIVRVHSSITRGDWADAEIHLGRFLINSPNGTWACHARYLLGICYLKHADLLAAESEFKYVVSHKGPSPLRRQAQLRLGDVALAAQEYDKAEEIFSELLQDKHIFKDAPEIMYKTGYLHQKQGRWREAELYFKKTARTYPGSIFAKRAAEQLAFPDHYSIQVGAFKNRERARDKENRLKQQGYTVFVQKLTKHKQPLYCVRIGSFSTRHEAVRFRSKMKNNIDFNEAVVVP